MKTQEKQTEEVLSTTIGHLRAAVRLLAPALLAHRTGSVYVDTPPQTGYFSFPYFNTPLIVTYPELIAYQTAEEACPLAIQALILYHFYTSNGAPLTGKWVSFANLLDGRMYAQAFQASSGDRLARTFNHQVDAFQQACLNAGGQTATVGDVAYSFQALPRIPLLVVYWPADEDFPAAAQILFDSSARDHLPIDVCAMLGRTLTSQILKPT